MAALYYIQKGLRIEDTQLKEKVGIVGYSMLEQAALNIPVSPGFIIELATLQTMEQKAVRLALDEGIQFIEKQTGRKFGDAASPLLLRVWLSPSLIMEKTPLIKYLGLNKPIADSLAATVKADHVYGPFVTFLEEYATLCLGKTENELEKTRQTVSPSDPKSLGNYLMSNLVKDFPQNPYAQLEAAIFGLAKIYHADPMNQDIPASLVIQYIPHGDTVSQLLRGRFTTRNVKTGEAQLNGTFTRCEFLTGGDEKEHDINQLDTALLDEFDEIAGTLEGFYLDVRQVDFLVEHGKIYVNREKQVEGKSMVTKLKILSELQSENQITDEEYVGSITPKELNSLLHSTINMKSVANHVVLRGGIAGSLGATSGKVYFSTKRLLEAFWQAKAEDGDTNLILLKKSTYAEDVQAVEIGCGVISSEGGYTSHAPIVARSLGKPAIVFPDITYHEGYVVIGSHKVNEGDYISMEI